MQVVEVKNLSKSYGGQIAVKNLSLGVDPGEILGLIGPNGAGKSSTIKIMLDFMKPDSGEIHLFGGPMSEATKNRIGYLPEARGLYKELKAMDCILYLASLKGMAKTTAKARAVQLLDHTGMLESEKKKIKHMSKGMGQMIQFIVTIMHDPELLIMDEPFSGLDPVNSELMKNMVGKYRDEGKAIILSTHQMNQVEELCDRVLMIDHGEEVLYGILTFIVPVIALIGIGIFNLAKMAFEEPEGVVTAIGYVDEVGDFDDHYDMGITEFVSFASREAADQALTGGKIAEYFVIPAEFMATGSLQRYTLEKEASTPPFITDMIWRFLSANLLDENTPPETIDLVLTPLTIDVTWVTEEGGVALEAANPVNVVIPGIFALLMSLSLMFGVTSLINGLGEEKESRLIDVLLSSVSIPQLLVSKVLALGLAGLLQVVLWLLSAPILLRLASSSLGDLLRGIEIPANFILLGVVYFVLGYLLFAVLSIGVGAISSNAAEGNTLATVYRMTGFIPL